MTTCAFDGKELAADSQFTDGNLKGTTVKIFQTDEYIMAFSGALDEGYQFKMILDDELKAKDCKFSKGFGALVWTSDGEITEWFDTMVPVPVYEKYAALGSGTAVALAAMHSGKTAREAVEIAKKLDVYTGGKVISYSWDPIKKDKKKKNEQLSKRHLQKPVLEVSGAGEPKGDLGGDSSPVHDLHKPQSGRIRRG